MDQSAHNRLIDYLHRVYGDILLEREGNRYPVTFFPAKDHAPDSLLSNQHPNEFADRGFPLYDRGHLQARKNNRKMQNKLAWILDTLETEPLRLSGKLGYYFDMIATCDAIDEELRAYARGEREDTPLRDKLHEHISPQESLQNGAGRSAVIGIATCIVFKNGSGYATLIGQRSDKLAAGAGLLHVIPAFIFQPSGSPGLYPLEWSLTHQIIREYGEELFAMPEYEDWPEPITGADYFHRFPAVTKLRTMFYDGRAKLYLTGVAFNLLTLRAEVSLLLLIHDPQWFADWQEVLSTQAGETEHPHLHTFPLYTLAGLPEDLHRRMAPHGAASLWAAIDLARRLTA